jgi:hypothetical protein
VRILVTGGAACSGAPLSPSCGPVDVDSPVADVGERVSNARFKAATGWRPER